MTQQQISNGLKPSALSAQSDKTPSFEDIYAMPYILESLNSIIDGNVRRYPVLAGHEEDIRQEILIHLWTQLQSYDPEKSSLKTYCRMVMRSGMNKARRLFFTESGLTLNYARPIHDFDSNNENALISDEDYCAMQKHSVNTVEQAMLGQDIDFIIRNLSSALRPIAKALQAGESLHSIADGMGIAYSTFQYKYLRPLRKEFRQKI